MDKPAPNFEHVVPIVKADDSKRLVYGVVYEPNVEDSQGDFASAPTIEKAAHDFMEWHQKMGVSHQRELPNIRIVESFIAPTDFRLGKADVKKGAWVLVSKVHDDTVWGLVLKGELTGYSIAGYGKAKD